MQQPYLARGRTYPGKMYLVRFWALKHLAGLLVVLYRCGRCFETRHILEMRGVGERHPNQTKAQFFAVWHRHQQHLRGKVVLQNERLTEIRCRLDALANQHCQAFFNNEPGPDLVQITGLLKEVDVMYDELGVHERAKADMMVGCGWHMLGQDDKAFDPLMRAVASEGCMSASDQLSAILVVMPLLRKKCQWRQIIEAGDKARKLAAGVWVGSQDDRTEAVVESLLQFTRHKHETAWDDIPDFIALDGAG
eukprot:s554_g6.t1